MPKKQKNPRAKIITKKQSDFINRIIEHGNKSKAYLQSYNLKNKNIARQKATILFKLPHVKKEYLKRKRKSVASIEKELHLTLSDAVKKLWSYTNFDVFEILDGNKKLKVDLPPYLGKIIQHIKFDKHGNVTDIIFPDRLKALDLVMKHLGGYALPDVQNNTQINYNIEKLDEKQLTALSNILEIEKV